MSSIGIFLIIVDFSFTSFLVFLIGPIPILINETLSLNSPIYGRLGGYRVDGLVLSIRDDHYYGGWGQCYATGEEIECIKEVCKGKDRGESI
ncbi:hypothetical protein N784_10545 [Pontibacillus litoralis JSM 072002]|uniref:Uncharacterized protein n=1 Tax=Pontibacillus litoralis JSM 072002 TaxID=1385512 RepID=A0A0A5GAN9_9BACI|nr:hypothetical protein [Pontibacillus litoralis]KGX88263.1 hypothetical protein N784_10545 [Pontibacillus litoralis JSM 072002]